MRRIGYVAVSALLVACGITYAPGDFLGSGGRAAPNTDATTPSDNGAAHDAASGDAGPPPIIHVLLLGGRRDALPGETGTTVTIGETMTTTIAPDGTLGAWAFDAPPPAALWTRAAIAGGQLFGQTVDVVAHTTFTDHITGTWTGTPIPKAPAPGVRPWILDEHGVTSGRSIDAPENVQAWTAPFADGGVGPWGLSPSHTTVVRGDSMLVRAANVVYAIGGRGPVVDAIGTIAPQGESGVEVAPIRADGTLGDFTAMPSLPVVDDSGAPYAVNSPVAVASADHVFVLGGLTTTKATSVSAVALAARIIDPATGALDAWTVLPPLPQAMTAFAAIATPSFVLVFGGANAAGKSYDAVLRLDIHPDGTFGSSWTTAGTLPGGRSAIAAVTY